MYFNNLFVILFTIFYLRILRTIFFIRFKMPLLHRKALYSAASSYRLSHLYGILLSLTQAAELAPIELILCHHLTYQGLC